MSAFLCIISNSEICLFIGVEVKLKNMKYPVIIAPTHISELNDIKHTERGVRFGASVTLTRLDEELKSAVQKYPGKLKIALHVQLTKIVFHFYKHQHGQVCFTLRDKLKFYISWIIYAFLDQIF